MNLSYEVTAKMEYRDIVSLLEQFSSHPSSFLATNCNTKCFAVAGINGFIAYRFSGSRYIISVAGINADSSMKELLLNRFIAWAEEQRRIIVAVQVHYEDAKIFKRYGFKINQIGASYCLRLAEYGLSGSFFMKLRNKISRAKKAGVQIKELGKDIAYSDNLKEHIRRIDNDWLKSKHAKKLDFLVGELGDINCFDFSCKRLFLAVRDGHPIAYILYVRCFGQFDGWMHELTRRTEDTIPGVMELINSSAIDVFKKEKVKYLNFGFTPLSSLNREHEFQSAYNPIMGWIFRLLAKRGEAIYPAKTQVGYKLKWAPDVVIPEYIAFGKKAGIGGLWSFLRLVKAI